MKVKILICLFAAVGLGVVATGCCTSHLVDSSRQKRVDLFRPTAVYQATNHAGFALEGFRANDYVAAEMREPSHKFVILSHECLVAAHLETNDDLSLDEIYRLPPGLTRQLKPAAKLPSGYFKTKDLPYSTWQIELNEQPPPKAMLVLTPFTVAVDVATAPIQLSWILLIGFAMANSHGC